MHFYLEDILTQDWKNDTPGLFSYTDRKIADTKRFVDKVHFIVIVWDI